MPFDIKSARDAGYSDQEIAEYLKSKSPNFDIDGAMKAGYSLDEIAPKINILKNTETTEPIKPIFGSPALGQGIKNVQQTQGILPKAWEALKIPERMSREGLQGIAQALPDAQTTDVTTNLMLNTPKFAAETLSEVAPSFVSRGGLATSGALKGLQFAAPAINTAGRYIGKTLEGTSGLGYKTPGVLAEAVNDPSLILGQGKKAAGEAYKAIQNPAQISPDLKTLTSNNKIINKALSFFRSNNLTPDEALTARQAVDQLSEKLPGAVKSHLRDLFDAVAKNKFAEADKAYARAIKSEALRNIFPVTKSGKPEFFRSAVLGSGLAASPFSPGALITAPLLSPAVQGAGAAGIGVAKKIAAPLVKSPKLGTSLPLFFKKKNENK